MKPDIDQHAVYTAQNATGLHGTALRLETLAEMEEYVATVMFDPIVQTRFNVPAQIDVQFSRSKRVSYAKCETHASEVVFGMPGRQAFTALHELAHVFTDGDRHGAAWRRCFLFLVRRFIGVEAWANLKYEFDQAGLTDNIFLDNRINL